MMPHTIQTIQLRANLGAVLEQVYYQAKQFRIQRKDKPMARLVNERFMSAIDQLLQDDPALADTLALLLNDEAMTIIERSRAEEVRGELIPLQEALV